MLETIIISSIQVIFVMVCVLTGCAWSTWLERKVVGHMQHRFGPTYAGPYGLLQPIADAVKLIFKEDIIPSNVERITYALAPILAFIPSMLSFAVIPFSPDFTVFGYHFNGMLSDLNIGILFVFAVTSLGVYGIILAGWSSGSKYSLLGGIRSSAQMISYEISYGLSIIGVILVAGTLSMRELVDMQDGHFLYVIPTGFVFKAAVRLHPLLICALSPKPIAPPSTSPKPNPNSSVVIIPSIRPCDSRCSSSANTPTCWPSLASALPCFSADGNPPCPGTCRGIFSATVSSAFSPK